MNKVLVIDGENLLHRSYHAAYKFWHEKKPDMYVRFFLTTLKSYVTQFNPSKIVVTWDYRKSGLSNERKELYEDYKKDRVFHEEVQEYADDIREMLTYLGVSQIHPWVREGDDIMYWLCAIKYPNQSILVSTDTDMYQLIVPELSGNKVFNPIKKIVITDNYLKTNYNVEDGRQFIVRKALKGDLADSIKGVGSKDKKLTKNRLDAVVKAMGSNFDIENVTAQNLLDDEELGVFLTNMDIMCLDRVKENTEELEYYEKQLSETPQGDRAKFKQFVAKHEFWTLMKQTDKIYNLFNPVNYNDLYTDLFG